MAASAQIHFAYTTHEWVELYNAEQEAVDLGGWWLDDIETGGGRPFRFPSGTLIDAQGFLVVYKRVSGIGFNNDGDTVRLLGPHGGLVEEFTYSSADYDLVFSKVVEGGSEWTEEYPPSPGRANAPATATPTPIPIETATMTPTPSATDTPELAPTPTPTPSVTVTPYPKGVELNEVLPAPRDIDWDGDGAANHRDETLVYTE